MTTADFLMWFDEVVSPTEPMMGLVEADFLDWKPTERSFTIGQLLAHMPRALRFNAEVLLEREGLPSLRAILISNRRHPSSTVDESIAMLHQAIHEFKTAVSSFDDHQFQTRIISTPQKGDVPAWRFCAFVIEHHIHHLMELHLSLKILGLPVSTKSLYTSS